jgi:hypothetical protein
MCRLVGPPRARSIVTKVSGAIGQLPIFSLTPFRSREIEAIDSLPHVLPTQSSISNKLEPLPPMHFLTTSRRL